MERVFPFFANEKNLEAITPPWLNFHVVGRKGDLIDYRLRLHGIPLRWQSRIEEWIPNKRFVDTQVRGPYRVWHHTHEFFSTPEGTRMVDTIRYQLPLGISLGRGLVEKDLSHIFQYRRNKISELMK